MPGCDVFISYKRDERSRVEALAAKLTSVGLKVWFDTRLAAGASFDDEIAANLKAAKAVLVCWTPGAIASDWVRAEAAMAHSADKLVAAFLAPTELIPPFNLIHAENLSDWGGEDDHAGWAKVLARIASMSGEAGLVEWATLMGAGDASALKKWVAAQPAGSLRSTTRYWLSEMNAAPIVGVTRTGIKPRKNAARGRGGVMPVVLSVALIGLIGAGGFYAWRMQSGEAATQVGAPENVDGAQAPNAARSGVVAQEAPPQITIANGTTVRVPINSLVDFETGRVSEADAANFDFEIVYQGYPRIRARGERGIARVNYGALMATAPNRRQCQELADNNGMWNDVYVAADDREPFQCFKTEEGNLGFFRVMSNPQTADGPVDLAVTFFD